MPNQASIITPWANEDGIYYPNKGFYADNKSYVDKEDNMMQSTIAIGDFSTVTKQVGQTEVRVALPNSMPSDERDKTSEDIFTLITFYNSLFGKSIGDYYMLAYAPETHTKNAIWAGEWSLSQGTSIRGNDYALTMVAHQLFHRWNGWTWGWESDRDTLGPLLMEGNNRYYEAKSILINIEALNHSTRDDYNYLNRLYEQYKEYYTKNEVINYIDSDAVKDGIYSWTAYGQGALIWLKLDLQILEDTDGKTSVDDLMHLLDDTYGRHKGNITLSLLKKHLKELTGNSYESFFEDYIYNTTYLELEAYFEDDDNDGYPNYYEHLRGSNPTSYTSGAPTELKSIQNTSQVLIIGSREPCEIFHNTHGIGQDLTGNPTSSQLNDASMIILLDSGRYGDQFNIFKDMMIENNQMVVQTIEGKQYIYIKATSDNTLLELIESLTTEQLYTDGLYNLN